MIHLRAMPGVPGHESVDRISQQAFTDGKILVREGIDALLLENMHDRPYLNRKAGPEVVATMAVVAAFLKKEFGLPAGIQVLAGANKEAIAIALASELEFIRAEGFVFGHLADEGWMDSDAGELLRYRKLIGADRVKIFTDIKKKHASHAVTNDITIEDSVRAAEFFLSDGIIITGKVTGEKPDPSEVKRAKENTSLPVIIGSGIDTNSVSLFWEHADAIIVGSSLKKDGKWYNETDPGRVKEFMAEIKRLKSK